jgi:The GLUG motif.
MMKLYIKKIAAIILVLSLFLGLIPGLPGLGIQTAYAGSMTPAQPAGDGSYGNPYKIAAVGNLLWLQQNNTANSGYSGKYFLQTANLNLGGPSAWIPIGDNSYHFRGTYDGGGYSINGIKNIDNSGLGGDYVGLFAFNNGTIQNLGLPNVNITDTGLYVGALVAFNQGTVQNCYTTGSVNNGRNMNGPTLTGGIVGMQSGGSIKNCYSTCTVSGWFRVGGIAGYVNIGEIDNCYATGSITNTNNTDYAGGITSILWGGGTVRNCFFAGTMVNGGIRGGIAGGCFESTHRICTYHLFADSR